MSLKDSNERLRWARERRGLTLHQAAAITGISAKTIQSHESGHRLKRGLSTEHSGSYARAYKVSETWLLTGEGDPANGRQSDLRVPVMGNLAAGIWTESFELPLEDQFDVWVPSIRNLASQSLYGAVVKGPSMNQVYPDGSIVICKRILPSPLDLEAGKRYHVERTSVNGRRENTLKTLAKGLDGSLWLMPESDDPAFKAAIPLPPETDDQILFIGQVVMALLIE